MYYVVYGFLWLLSLLPMRLLYFISDGIYTIVFYILKYRRDVVIANLQIAFPEKTPAEREVIAKKFYHNLIDTFIETIKMISVSEKFIEKRFSGNWEVINSLKQSGRSIQLHLGHNFNWEWGNVIVTKNIDLPFLAVYMPVRSKIFERLMYGLRSRSGSIMLRATKMAEDFIPYRRVQHLLGLVADQNAGHPANAWWVSFFNRPTPFVKGPARNAIANNTSVVFAFIHKPHRGYYEAVFTLATENPQYHTEEELTKMFVRYMEEVIRQNPDMWLWSHRRWKWQWKEEYGPVLEK